MLTLPVYIGSKSLTAARCSNAAPFNGQLPLAQQGPAAGKTLNPTQASVAAVEQKPESFGWRQ